MKSSAIPYLLNQRKLPVHIIIVGVSLSVALFAFYNQPLQEKMERIFQFFLLMFVQMELFLWIGASVFKKIKPGNSRREITRMVLTRFVIFIVLCFFLAFVLTILYCYLAQIGTNSPEEVFRNFMKFSFKGWLKGTLGGLFLGGVFFIYMQWQDALTREQKLREEKLIFQNQTLKNQVNPHFLFNSLNTLSSLININPEVAEKFTIRLSSIYRYILEKSCMERVSLEEELTFIRDYFYLHKIRGEEKIQLEINVAETDNFEIMPVSLQGLIENAIKHNKATRENPLKIEISREGEYIVVKNNLQKMSTKFPSTGIGLKNLGERITLATGKNLIIKETGDQFIVKLPLL